MAQFLFLIAVALAPSVNFAEGEVQNDCSRNTLKLNDWSELTESVRTCLTASPEFESSIVKLCQPNRVQILKRFELYLKYKELYTQTLAWIQSLPLDQQFSPTVRDKLKRAKQDWEILGDKVAVGIDLDKMEKSYLYCTLPK